jgi:hypothetical protein
MKLGERWLAFWSLVFSGVIILSAIIILRNTNVSDPLGFVAFWGIFITHWFISIRVMKRGLLVPFIWSLAWFFTTGLAAFIAGILAHGIP